MKLNAGLHLCHFSQIFHAYPTKKKAVNHLALLHWILFFQVHTGNVWYRPGKTSIPSGCTRRMPVTIDIWRHAVFASLRASPSMMFFLGGQTWITIYWKSSCVSAGNLLPYWQIFNRCSIVSSTAQTIGTSKGFCSLRTTIPVSSSLLHKGHVFGNSPSPAVTIYGLRRAAMHGEREHGAEERNFIKSNIYRDDGLSSFPTDKKAISILKSTKATLAESSIKLHKIASNICVVMEAFPPEERAKSLVDLEPAVDPLPLQRSLDLT